MTPHSTHAVFDSYARILNLWLIASLVVVSNSRVLARPAGRSSGHRHRHRHGHFNYQIMPTDPIQCFPTPVNVTAPKDTTRSKTPLSDHFYRVSTDAKNLKNIISRTMERYHMMRFKHDDTALWTLTMTDLPTVPVVTIDTWNENNVNHMKAMVRSHDWLTLMTGHLNVTMAHEKQLDEGEDGFEDDIAKVNLEVIHLVCRIRGMVVEHDVGVRLEMGRVLPIPDITYATKIYHGYLRLQTLHDVLYHTEVEFNVLHRTMKQRENFTEPPVVANVTASSSSQLPTSGN